MKYFRVSFSCLHVKKKIFQLQRLKLFTENTMEDAGLSLEVSNSSYLKVLVPEDKEQSTIEPCLPSNVVSLHALRALPIQEQCKLLLKDGTFKIFFNCPRITVL